jgi:hypothetical protein
MKTVFRYAFIILMIVCLFSCQKNKPDMSLLTGVWNEYYEDQLLSSDTDNTYTIKPDVIKTHSYNLLTGKNEEWSIEYKVDGNTITLNYPSGYSNKKSESFEIVLLTDEEMAWQKVGTTFSKKSYGNDYRHFVNEKYWKSHPTAL